MNGNYRLAWRKNWPDIEAATCGGFPSFVWQRNPDASLKGIPVFCYHVVGADQMEADCAFLQRNGYRTLSVEEALRSTDTLTPPERAVVLTVDDGAFNLYEVIYPVCRRYGMRLIAFVAPLFHQDQYALPDTARPCTWGELAEMQDSGVVDVQAHTYSHRYIPRWPEPLDLAGIDCTYSRALQSGQPAMDLRDDLAAAKEMVESRLQKTVEHLAFPMYRGSAACIQQAKELGYQTFWTGTQRRHPLYGVSRGTPAHPPTEEGPVKIPRLSAEFIRRLPGEGRVPLSSIVSDRVRRKSRP